MVYPQSTLEEIIDSEQTMLIHAPRRYGRYYAHARTTAMYLTHCVESIELDRADMFGRLASLMKKQQMLAFFSVLRLHKVQAMMNLRQVLEAGAAAAFAIANPEAHHFVDIDAFGIMDPTQNLTSKRYKWLQKNYPDKSDWIKAKKDLINTSTAHANIVSGNSTFRLNDDHSVASTPFFDVEDEYYVKADLWLISTVAITLMDFFFGVAGDVAKAGRSVIEFRSDFQETIHGLAAESTVLLHEMQASDRFRQQMQKHAQRATAGKG